MAQDTPHHIRLKLDKRIHQQRVALRENWMIAEQRTAGTKRWMYSLHKRASEMCDKFGIPRGEGSATFALHKRLSLLEERFAALNPEERS